MSKEYPLISIIVPTYNRAHTIQRSVDSILRQTYKNYEIIIVDDGSTDETKKVLSKYSDKRIRIIYHENNKGVCAAKNSGLNEIRGEWFTILDSDDEMIENAIEELISVPYEIDKTIDAVTCNCIDSVTGEFSGKGVDKDQYLDESIIIRKFSGEHWGLTKTSLLRGDRFNERRPDIGATLWYKLNERSNRYYIHKGLRIYHTEGNDRVTKTKILEKILTKGKEFQIYQSLKEETLYLIKIKHYIPKKFASLCFQGMIVSKAQGDYDTAQFFYNLLKKSYVFDIFTFRVLCNSVFSAGVLSANLCYFVIKILKLIKYTLIKD